MGNYDSKQDIINGIANDLNVSPEDVMAVMYGEQPNSGERVRSPIMKALGDDGRGVFICAVWKGTRPPNAVENMPTYDFYGQILEGLNLSLHKNGYVSQLLVSNLALADYAYFESIFAKHPSAGIVNIAGHFTSPLTDVCEDYKRPIVFLDYPATADPTGQYIISINSRTVIEDIVAYLYDLGHRRIAFIQGPQRKQTALDRYAGYLDGLDVVGLAFDESLVFTGNWEESAGAAAARYFLKLEAPPTAIVASNDLMAFGAMKVIQGYGLNVPCDISITGFDDIASASQSSPPLSSVHTPMTQIGARAGEYIIRLLEGDSPSPRMVSYEPEFIERNSTTAAPTSP